MPINNFSNVIDIRSNIFTAPKIAIEWMLELNLITKEIECSKCLQKMILEADASYMNSFRFRCCYEEGCGRSVAVLSNTLFKNPKICINDYLLIIFLFVERNFAFNISRNSRTSASTVYRVKKNIYELLTKENKKNSKKIGGFEETIQADETVIVKGKFIKSPSETYDVLVNSTWLVGCIDIKTKEIRISIVPNRSAPEMIKFFKKYIHKETTCLTDGHKSYPKAVKAISGDHKVVNHEEGFKNNAGETTNMIEGVWSQLKSEISYRKGIKASAIPDFLEEFKWRRRCALTKNMKKVEDYFIELVTLFCK